MKEHIVDFELYEGGSVIKWLQQSFQLKREGLEDTITAFTYWHEYASKHWGTEGTELVVRIKNIWTVEVE